MKKILEFDQPVEMTEIWFNEWQIVKGHPSTVRRIPFALSELLGKNVTDDGNIAEGQLSLFDLDDFSIENESEEKPILFEEINIQKVYLLGD